MALDHTAPGYKHPSRLTAHIQCTSLTSEPALLPCNGHTLDTTQPKEVFCCVTGWRVVRPHTRTFAWRTPLQTRRTKEKRGGGTKSEVAHKWARWLHNPCRVAGPASEQGAESEVAHIWARWLHNPCRLGGSPPLQRGGQNQRWPTSGQGGYITPAAWGVPTASDRGGRIRGGPQVGRVATQPLPPGGSPPLQSGGQNQRWPTSGQDGYITPAAWGVPTASEGGAESEVAHKWARWLHNPCRLGVPTASEPGAESEVAHKWAGWLHNPCHLGGPHRFRSGGRIRGGPQVGRVATQPLPPGGVPTASEPGAESEVAHKWARWLHNPCRLGSPPLQIGGQNQKWQQSELENLIFWGPRNKAWISEWGDIIRNSPQLGPVAVRSGKTYFLGK